MMRQNNLTSTETLVGYTPGHWTPSAQEILTYDASNRLITDSASFYDSSSTTWHPSYRYAFGYTTGVSYFTSEEIDVYGMSLTEPDTLYTKNTFTKHISAAGLPDTVYFSNYTGGPAIGYLLSAGKKLIFSYDGYKNPTIASSYKFNIADSATGTGAYSTMPDRTFFYYYETYLGVNNTMPNDARASFFPNPAADEVNISRPGFQAGSPVQVVITNSVGSTVRLIAMPWLRETETISLRGLAPGAYIVTVIDADGGKLFAQKVIKY